MTITFTHPDGSTTEVEVPEAQSPQDAPDEPVMPDEPLKAPTLAEIIEATKQSPAYRRMVEEANAPLIERFKRESRFWQALRGKRSMTRYD